MTTVDAYNKLVAECEARGIEIVADGCNIARAARRYANGTLSLETAISALEHGMHVHKESDK